MRSYNSARTAEKFLEYIKEQLQADSGFARVDALDDLVGGWGGRGYLAGGGVSRVHMCVYSALALGTLWAS
jgi:hypothetical protein